MNDYQAKFVTPEQAVKAVQSGDWVDYGFGAGFPELLVTGCWNIIRILLY